MEKAARTQINRPGLAGRPDRRDLDQISKSIPHIRYGEVGESKLFQDLKRFNHNRCLIAEDIVSLLKR